MALCLLLSKDAALQSGMERGLSRLSPPPTLLTLDHDQDLDTILESLSEVKLLMVDLRHFTPPSRQEIPVLLLEGESPSPLLHAHPCIQLPVRPAELSSLVHHLLTHSADSGTAGGWDRLSFFLRVQREILHDLNNRQTTLQGHLPLLADTCKGEEKEILSDICTAAEQSGRLLKVLEAMNPDAACVPDTVTLTPFLKKLSSLSRRIPPPTAKVDFHCPESEISILADEALLTLCLLNGIDVLSSPDGVCTLNTLQEEDLLRLQIRGTSAADKVDASLLHWMNQRLHPMGARVTGSDDGLVYTLKTVPSPPTSE